MINLIMLGIVNAQLDTTEQPTATLTTTTFNPESTNLPIFIPPPTDNVFVGIPYPCPEYPSRDDCLYPRTNANRTLGAVWTCRRGFYCLRPGLATKCDPGFYCPDNAIQPIYCPRGYYCSEDAASLKICPENFFCPIGSTEPQGCHYLASCPEGSHDASKVAVGVGFIAFLGIIYFIFYIRERSLVARQLKRSQELERLINPSLFEPKPQLARLEQTFDIEFRNIGLKLKNDLIILNGVSGTFKAGRMCAIMGPSGSGKTSLLTVLSGKLKRTNGEILINGHPEELLTYSKLVGYVPQEDVMLRELSVREILMHSARMRLPSTWKYPAVKEKVLDIVSFLGLSHIAQSAIGNEEIRGISGGERKRVNIGMELVTEPSVLFLDEPTSGLDSSTSLDVCINLRSIAQQQGLTVAAVVHSPSPECFRQFDDILLLGKGGEVVYMGPRSAAVDYFDAIGFRCPPSAYPADYFLEVISGRIPSEFDPCFAPPMLVGYWHKFQQGILPNATLHRMDKKEAANTRSEFLTRVMSVKHKNVLRKKFNASFFTSVRDGLYMIYSEVSLWLGSAKDLLFSRSKGDQVRETANFWTQLLLLLGRSFNQIYTNSNILLSDMMLHFAAGMFISVAIQNFDFLGASPKELCAFAPWNVARVCSNTLDNLKEAGMFIALGSFFAGVSIGVTSFGREKVVFLRDSDAGMSTVAYYLAKVAVDVPRIILGAFIFTTALILVFPYRQDFINLLAMVLSLYFAAFSMAYWISIVFAQNRTPLVGTGLSLLFSIALSGVIPTLDKVNGTSDANVLDGPFPGFPLYVRFLWSLSAPRWAIEAFWIKEVQYRPFKEKFQLPTNQYRFENYEWTFVYIFLISIGWHVLALCALKLQTISKK